MHASFRLLLHFTISLLAVAAFGQDWNPRTVAIPKLISLVNANNQTATSAGPRDLLTDGKYHGHLLSAAPVRSEQTMNAAFWRTDAGFKSVVHLNNLLLTNDLTVTPTIFMSDGYSIDLPTVNVRRNGVSTIDINDALANIPASQASHISSHGSMRLRYSHFFPGSLKGSIDVTNLGQSLTFSFMFYDVPQGMAGPHTIEGMWWKRTRQVTGFLVLSNTTSQAESITVATTDQKGVSYSKRSFRPRPHETMLIDLDVLIGPNSSSQGGLTITYFGGIGDLLVAGGLQDASVGYSNRMPMQLQMNGMDTPAGPKQGLSGTRSMTFIGLMNGTPEQSLGFGPEVNFVPYEIVRNVSGEPLVLKQAIHYMQSGKPASFDLGDIRIEPRQTKNLNLAELLLRKELETVSSITLVATYQSQDANLMLQAGSVDQSGNYVFDVEPTGALSTLSKPIRYWTADGTFDTMVNLYNISSTPSDVNLTLFFNGDGRYVIPIHLDGDGQLSLDIGDYVRRQQPDAEGNTIPIGVQVGSASLSDPSSEVKRISVLMNASEFSVTYGTCDGVTCYTCDGYTHASLTCDYPPNGNGTPLNTMQMHAMVTYYTGNIYDNTTSGQWSSTNSGVAAIGSAQGSMGKLTTVAAGSTTISWTEYAELNIGYVCAPTSPCNGWVSGGTAPIGLALATTYGANTGGHQDVLNARFCGYTRNCSNGNASATCPPNSNSWTVTITTSEQCVYYIRNSWLVLRDASGAVEACFGAVFPASGAGACD